MTDHEDARAKDEGLEIAKKMAEEEEGDGEFTNQGYGGPTSLRSTEVANEKLDQETERQNHLPTDTSGNRTRYSTRQAQRLPQRRPRRATSFYRQHGRFTPTQRPKGIPSSTKGN